MRCAVVLFARDLRVHDNPALAGACEVAEQVLPVFVADPAIRSSPNRDRFLAESLADLRDALRGLGGDLVIRAGDPVAEVLRLAREVRADGIAVAADVSGYARRRIARLAQACARERIDLREFPGLTVVPPGALKPSGGNDFYQIFTPYHRAWLSARWRPVAPAPARLRLPPGTPAQRGRVGRHTGATSPEVATGGESQARAVLRDWTSRVDGYPGTHDLPGADATSRLSPYLRFGCLSPRELAAAVPQADGFLRQLCWRDFYHQLLAGFPALGTRALRPHSDSWHCDEPALRRWRDGETGIPIVDAGMRQLAAEGWMHNRARLITAGFLTRHLGLDWRAGLAVFAGLLLDADAANNPGNWQWVAGVGTDTRPYRRFNPIRQAHRFDPDGAYVRSYVPELSRVEGGAVHEPWKLSGVPYPPPLLGASPTPWLPGR